MPPGMEPERGTALFRVGKQCSTESHVEHSSQVSHGPPTNQATFLTPEAINISNSSELTVMCIHSATCTMQCDIGSGVHTPHFL